jgi:hypothetical protein
MNLNGNPDLMDNRVVLELGIYISHIIWRFRYRKLRKEAKESGRSIDDLLGLTSNDTQESTDVQTGGVDQSRDVEKQDVGRVVET